MIPNIYEYAAPCQTYHGIIVVALFISYGMHEYFPNSGCFSMRTSRSRMPHTPTPKRHRRSCFTSFYMSSSPARNYSARVFTSVVSMSNPSDISVVTTSLCSRPCTESHVFVFVFWIYVVVASCGKL